MSQTESAIKDLCWQGIDLDRNLFDDVDFLLLNKADEIDYEELDYLVSISPSVKDDIGE